MSTKKRIIVQRQKHGDAYYDASTKEAEENALKQIFKANEEMEFYYNMDDKDFKKEKEKLESDIKKIEALKIDELPTDLQRELEKQKKDLSRKQRELSGLIEEKAIFDKAKAGDVVALKRFLNMKKDGEYEGFSYEDLQ